MNRCEIPQPDYDDPKELYAFFGLTFYMAQVLEQGVVNLAIALSAKRKGNVTGSDVLRLYEDYDGKTFGKVLRAAEQFTTFPPSLQADLRKALQYRNYLAHSFFVQHSDDAKCEKCRRAMIDELREILTFLERVDTEFDSVWMSAWHALGVNKEWFQQKLKEIQQAHEHEQGGPSNV